MKRQFISLIVMYLSLLTLFSCNEKEDIADTKATTLTPIVNQKLADIIHSHATEVLDGEVVIRVFQYEDNYEFVVLLAPKASATKTRLFRLQTEHTPEVSKRILNRQQRGRVFFFKDAFLLQLAGDKHLYAAQLDNAPQQFDFKKVSEFLAINEFLALDGYGVSKHRGSWSTESFLQFDGVRLMDFLLETGNYSSARVEG